MRAKKLIVAGCLIVGMFCSSGFALNFLGTPTAELSKGQLEFGAEYTFGEFALYFLQIT